MSEVLKLKPEDVDTKRKLIRIRGAKGRKDRYTILSDIALNALNEYTRKEIQSAEMAISRGKARKADNYEDSPGDF